MSEVVQSPPRRRLLKELFNAPNLVTLGRMALIPVFLTFLAYESRRNSFFGGLIFAAAAATDALDGFLARRTGQITVMGKFLDPLADKLIVLSALVELVWLGRVQTWVVLLILARELIITGLRTIAVSEGLVIAAGEGGKWKSALQMIGIVGLCAHYRYPIDFIFTTEVVDFHLIGTALLYLSLPFMLLSAFEYFRAFWKVMEEKDAR
jgi:CDP-diacylglycerol--glycerol-3-phosphate 3-phosphatidyltransferase